MINNSGKRPEMKKDHRESHQEVWITVTCVENHTEMCWYYVYQNIRNSDNLYLIQLDQPVSALVNLLLYSPNINLLIINHADGDK